MSNKIKERYKEESKNVLKYLFPNLYEDELDRAIDYSIGKRYKKEPCHVDNSYKEKTVNMNLLDMTNYILEREPIQTAYGVLFKKHADAPNPLMNMTKIFMDNRNILKKEMFKHPKGSEEYEKYNLLQLLAKLDSNGLYGCIGAPSSLFFNIDVASSTTLQGRSYISTGGLFFEAFLSNNVKLASLDEVIAYFNNITGEERHFDDRNILDRDITREECFIQVMDSCGFGWLPTEEEMDIIWTLINRFDQTDINRIYYKNNLYAFMDNKVMNTAVSLLLNHLNVPFLDPNEPPKEIAEEIDAFVDLIEEYVFYGHPYIDRIDRWIHMIKNSAVISDTDSAIVSMDGWYRYILKSVNTRDMKIRCMECDAVSFADKGKLDSSMVSLIDPYMIDYDFNNDDIIEIRRSMSPCTIIPEDNLRYSIINILGYTLSRLLQTLFLNYTKISNSYSPDKPCLIIMKNEFLFRRALLTDGKKNYATIQEVQEGNMVPPEKQLDIKGLQITKTGNLSDDTKSKLKSILYEDILMTPVVDQVKVIKSLAIFEKQIMNSLRNGERKYYKTTKIKALHNYDDPMRLQGIKASVIWNAVRDPELYPAIDLNDGNTIDIVKVDITPAKLKPLEELYPDTYNRFVELFKDPIYKNKINSIALPKDISIPEWLQYVIDYTTIVNDNLSTFPLEAVGISKVNNSNNNYSNIISI